MIPSESAQQTWSPPSPLLGAKEFDPGEDVQSIGFFTAPLGFTGAANAAAGIRLLPLPRLSFLPYEGAGDRCSHGQLGCALGTSSAGASRRGSNSVRYLSNIKKLRRSNSPSGAQKALRQRPN